MLIFITCSGGTRRGEGREKKKRKKEGEGNIFALVSRSSCSILPISSDGKGRGRERERKWKGGHIFTLEARRNWLRRVARQAERGEGEKTTSSIIGLHATCFLDSSRESPASPKRKGRGEEGLYPFSVKAPIYLSRYRERKRKRGKRKKKYSAD